jgi:hypothetical protein
MFDRRQEAAQAAARAGNIKRRATMPTWEARAICHHPGEDGREPTGAVVFVRECCRRISSWR